MNGQRFMSRERASAVAVATVTVETPTARTWTVAGKFSLLTRRHETSIVSVPASSPPRASQQWETSAAGKNLSSAVRSLFRIVSRWRKWQQRTSTA